MREILLKHYQIYRLTDSSATVHVASSGASYVTPHGDTTSTEENPAATMTSAEASAASQAGIMTSPSYITILVFRPAIQSRILSFLHAAVLDVWLLLHRVFR